MTGNFSSWDEASQSFQLIVSTVNLLKLYAALPGETACGFQEPLEERTSMTLFKK